MWTCLINSRAVSLCVLSLAAFMGLTPAAYSDECLNTDSSTTELDFAPCDAALPEIDLDAALADHAATKSAISASAATPWIAQQDKSVPLTINSSDTSVSLRTSLDDLRNFNTRKFAIEPDARGAIALPKAGSLNLPVDVWTSVDVSGYQGDRDQSTRTGVGVDYKLTRSTVFGASVERADAYSTTAGSERDSKASAYVTLQATPLLSLDARTEWQAGNAEFAAANGAAEKGSVTFAPKINHSFALGEGKTISPFVTYKRAFDISTSPAAFDAPERSAGAGLTYKDADAYTLSVTTDVDEATATAPQSVSSKFKLSVPIN